MLQNFRIQLTDLWYFVMNIVFCFYVTVNYLFIVVEILLGSAPTNTCLKPGDNGAKYAGTVNVTVSGTPCQRWSALLPHLQAYFDILDHEENYCRNPNNDVTPWCYTMDVNRIKEYCLIPTCLGW